MTETALLAEPTDNFTLSTNCVPAENYLSAS